MSEPKIEAIDIVALAIDEVKARGAPRHSKALGALTVAKELWKEKFSHRGKSPREVRLETAARAALDYLSQFSWGKIQKEQLEAALKEEKVSK